MKLVIFCSLVLIALQCTAEETKSDVPKKMTKKGLPFWHIGCYRDRPARALRIHLATFHRNVAIHRCANLAKKRGFRFFSVQYGGQCFSGPNAGRTYFKYGKAHNCRNGLGGTWANNVYKLKNIPYKAIGCYRDRPARALRIHLATFHRNVAIQRCASLAKRRGFSFFSVQYGGQCFSGPNAGRRYYKYGKAHNCRNGLGGTWANNVYRLTIKPVVLPKTLRRIGCYRDRPARALPVHLATFRGNVAIQRCASLAKRRGFSVFSVQYGGQCFSGPNAGRTYYKYGKARNCRNGLGGTWANNVYKLKRIPYKAIGCYRDRPARALRLHLATFHRNVAIQRCASLAKRRGFSVFSVQYGGQCFSGPNAGRRYYKYGKAHNCRNGLGGTWANNVYRFTKKPVGRKFRKINRGTVCFEARNNKPGKFTYRGPNRIVKGLLLVYRSGYVSCHYSRGRSRWGCGGHNLNVVVTDQYNYLIYPRKEYYVNRHQWYRLPGKHSRRSRSLFFSNVAAPFHMTGNSELRVWYGEDLINYTERDNRGRACVDVYAWFA